MLRWMGLLLLLALRAAAQDGVEQIELGTNLKLGLTQADTLALVGKHFEARPMQDNSHYIVYVKPAEGEKPKWEGILTFKAGKLAAVERLWAYDDNEHSVAMAKSFFGALTSIVRSGTSTCKVEDQISDAPDAQGESVLLSCGKRSIKISVAKVEGYREDASVSELLEQ